MFHDLYIKMESPGKWRLPGLLVRLLNDNQFGREDFFFFHKQFQQVDALLQIARQDGKLSFVLWQTIAGNDLSIKIIAHPLFKVK